MSNNTSAITKSNNVNNELTLAQINASKLAPAFAQVICLMRFEARPEIEQWIVTKGWKFLYNQEWIAERTVQELTLLILRASIHLAFKHGDRLGLRQPERWGKACEIGVGSFIKTLRKLPVPSSWTPDWAGSLIEEEIYERLPEYESDSIYERLPEHESDCNEGKSGQQPKGQQEPKGSGAGQPHPAEQQEDNEAPNAMAQRHAQESTLQRLKQAGNLPQGLERWIDGQLAPPQVRWQDQVMKFKGQVLARMAGIQEPTKQRPARRQAIRGVTPGSPLLSSWTKNQPVVVFCEDTSGSMSAHQLTAMRNELAAVIHDAETWVVEVDADVHRVRRVSSIAEINTTHGGGGTDFRPAFEAAKKIRGASLIIFATDGYGPAPEVPPSTPVIWLLIGDATVPAPWGKVIRIKDVAGKISDDNE